jgi:hypothetical protein
MFVSEVSLVMAKKVDLYKPKDEPGPEYGPEKEVQSQHLMNRYRYWNWN